jgi:hypothetical protein
VPFLIKLVEYPGTPDRAAILDLLAAMAGDGTDGDSAAKTAHAAVGAGLPLYLSLLDTAEDPALRAAAVATLTAFPERAAESVPPLQAALAVEPDPMMHLRLIGALAQVMDASEQAQAYFADVMGRADDPHLAFQAAAALAGRAGEATPQPAVDTLVEAVGIPVAVGPDSEYLNQAAALAAVGIDQWPGEVELAVLRLGGLGPERAQPALLRAFQRTRKGKAARTVAEGLLDLAFNVTRPQSRSIASSRLPDGRRTFSYWGTAKQPERAAASLTPGQRAALEALAAHDPFWEQEHDLLALYGLPATRAELSAFLAAR